MLAELLTITVGRSSATSSRTSRQKRTSARTSAADSTVAIFEIMLLKMKIFSFLATSRFYLVVLSSLGILEPARVVVVPRSEKRGLEVRDIPL